jgi:hypothetical protein
MMAMAILGASVEEPAVPEETWVEDFLPDEEVGLDFLIRPNIPCAGSRQKSDLAAGDRFGGGRLKSSAGTFMRSGAIVPSSEESCLNMSSSATFRRSET